jgi:ribose-phosphate pyrophosphokinase
MVAADTKPLLFSSTKYNYLARQMYASGKFDLGYLGRSNFPDCERYRRYLIDASGGVKYAPVEDRRAVIVGGTCSDATTMELFSLMFGAWQYGAQSIDCIIPYFGYSTMERAVKPGEIVEAKVRAVLLSSLPRPPAGTRIFLMDLHAEGIEHYFEGGMRTKHVYAAKHVVSKIVKELTDKHEFVIGSPELEAELAASSYIVGSTDAGRAKWIESIAKDLALPPAFAYKARLSGSKTTTLGIIGPVAGKIVIMYDDMIRTGGSAINAAKAYKAAGALAVVLIATHCVMPGNSLQKLQSSGCFEQIIVTDTHPRARMLAKKNNHLRVEPVSDLFVSALHL